MKIIHITPQNIDWKNCKRKGIYSTDTLQSQGFIHCCLPEQVESVIEKWFKGVQNLLLLEIETDDLSSKVIFENLEGGREQFPHVYGPIDLKAITIARMYKGNGEMR